jgi:general secretion pathway protein K
VMRSALRFNRRGERGVVLVFVLLIIMVLAVILLEFSDASNLEMEIAGNSCRSEQALNCADAGVNFALAVLRQNPDALHDETLKPLLSGQTAIPIGEGACKVIVEVENGRLNVNALTSADGRVDRVRVDQMLRLVDLLNAQDGMDPPISYNVVASMIDWATDNDDTTTLAWVQGDNEGAKNDYYLAQTPPCLCKCAPFDSLDELRRVRDVTPLILDGRPADEAADVKAIEGMRNQLTVYGDGKVDINFAPSLVLQALSPEIDEDMAKAMIALRTQSPFRTVADLRMVPNFPTSAFNAIKDYATTSPGSRYFSIISTGAVNGFERRVREVVQVQGSQSDATVLLRREP